MSPLKTKIINNDTVKDLILTTFKGSPHLVILAVIVYMFLNHLNSTNMEFKEVINRNTAAVTQAFSQNEQITRLLERISEWRSSIPPKS
jgi:hypothetical protein